MTDIIDRLAGGARRRCLRAARRHRPATRDNAQASYDALFTDVDEAPATLAERAAVAQFVAVLHADEVATAHYSALTRESAGDTLDDLIAAYDTHVGTVDEVIESLSRDAVAAQASEVAFQVHSVDPPHELVLRSIELIAREVAPALGWGATAPAAALAR